MDPKGSIMDNIIREACVVCSRESHYSLIYKYRGVDVRICEEHARAYSKRADNGGDLVEYDKHCRILDDLINIETNKQIHNIKQNADYMAAIMDSWNDGCLSDLEALNKIAILTDETRNMALNLLK